jgi:hypothetical protein
MCERPAIQFEIKWIHPEWLRQALFLFYGIEIVDIMPFPH